MVSAGGADKKREKYMQIDLKTMHNHVHETWGLCLVAQFLVAGVAGNTNFASDFLSKNYSFTNLLRI